MELDEKYIKIISKTFPRFWNNFVEKKEIDSIILKGHLLIEELIKELLVKLKGPSNVSQKFKINADKLFSIMEIPEELDWIKESTFKLNKLRNKVAHNLDTSFFDEKINDFIDSVPLGEGRLTPHNESDSYGEELRNCIFVLWVSFVYICSEVYEIELEMRPEKLKYLERL